MLEKERWRSADRICAPSVRATLFRKTMTLPINGKTKGQISITFRAINFKRQARGCYLMTLLTVSSSRRPSGLLLRRFTLRIKSVWLHRLCDLSSLPLPASLASPCQYRLLHLAPPRRSGVYIFSSCDRLAAAGNVRSFGRRTALRSQHATEAPGITYGMGWGDELLRRRQKCRDILLLL